MGFCESINCGYWYEGEEDDFPCCHYEDDDGCAPCDEEEGEE